MIKIKKIAGVLIVLLIVICNINKSYGIGSKDILFISSYSPSFISFKDQIEGIESVLEDEFSLKIQYMNVESFDNKVNERDFYNSLKRNISTYKNLEGILIGDDEALDFYLKYKEDLFKDIPTSFFAISNIDNIEKALIYKNVSGVREVESINEIIELIANYHKNTENIVFIDNNNTIKNYIENNKGKVLKYNDFNFEWIITNDIYSNNFESELKKIKENSAIISLYPIHFKDVRYLSYYDINKEIIDNTNNIPI